MYAWLEGRRDVWSVGDQANTSEFTSKHRVLPERSYGNETLGMSVNFAYGRTALVRVERP